MRIISFGFRIIVFLAVLELALRWVGLGPYIPHHYKIQAHPAGCLLPSQSYGLNPNPGHYDVTLNDSLSFQVTHGIDGTRITHIDKSISLKEAPKLYMHGCSFTYGLGIDDSLTYPYLLHQETDYAVTNYAVPGFGSLPALLMTIEQLKAGHRPSVLILNYLRFHDERNSFSRRYREQLQLALELNEGFLWKEQQFAFPFEEWGYTFASMEGDSLQTHRVKALEVYDHFPFRRQSAIVNQAEGIFNNLATLFSRKRNHKVTQGIVAALHNLCQQHNIRLMVSIMTQDKQAKNLQRFCQKHQIETIDLAIDFDDPQYTLMPYDGHPSAAAHRVFADRIKEALGINRNEN